DSGAISGFGNGLDNQIVGNAADNVLDGGGGNDTLVGGAGNDTYFVDGSADVITEAVADGTDTVHIRSGIYAGNLFILSANVENATLETASITVQGNSLANTIVGSGADDQLGGNTGDDVISGGAGNDSIYGGADNDTLRGDAGVDTLSGDIGNDILLGGADNDVLWGQAGDDTRDGGAGADWMAGGAGNDTYNVDNSMDNVIENPGEGIDTVHSTLAAYTLAANVEILVLDSGAISGFGNGLDNQIGG